MDLTTLLKRENELLLRKPITHTVKGTDVVINTLTVAQISDINPYLMEIGTEDITLSQQMIETFDYAKLPEMIERCLPALRKIVEIIHGDDLADIAELEDYFIIFSLIYSRIGNSSFHKSIILITKMSLSRPTEIIAVRKFLTSLN